MVYTIGQQVNGVEKSGEIKVHSVWKEVVIAVLVNLPFFTHGVEATTLTSSTHSGHFANYNEPPWTTTAMIATTGIAAPIFCYIVDRYGRMTGVFLISMLQGISLIPHFLLNSRNIYTIQILLHILVGLSSAGLFTSLPMFLREITTIRGFSITLIILMTTAGYMMKMVMIEVRLYVMVAMVGIQFLGMLALVESPSYLMMVMKYEKARRNISKLTGLPEDAPHISREISHLKDEIDNARMKGDLSIRTVWRNKIWLDSVKLGIMLYTLTALCGSILFLDQQKTLLQLKVPADPGNTLVVSALLAGSAFTVICAIFVDIKYLLTTGYVIMTLSIGVLAVYTQVDLTINSLRWMPFAALSVLVFGYGIVWGAPVIIMSQVFNVQIRATLLGALYTYYQIIKLLHINTFKYIEDYIGVYSTFYIFACINLFGVVYTLFVVPSVRNKSIKQIERQLKRPTLPA